MSSLAGAGVVGGPLALGVIVRVFGVCIWSSPLEKIEKADL